MTADLVRWRTGTSVGRTLYLQGGPEPSKADVLIGVMDTRFLATLVVAAVNDYLDRHPALQVESADLVWPAGGGDPC